MSSYLTRSYSQHKFLRPAPPRRISLPASQRLNTIFERDSNGDLSRNGGDGRLRNGQRSHLGDPPLASDEKSPPNYDPDWAIAEDGVRRGGRSSGARKRSSICCWETPLSSRGGLRRLALLLSLALLAILGLALGLGLGLTIGRRRRHHHSTHTNSSSNTNTATHAFPIGSWLFDVVLSDVVTDCTANPATWACFPYATYAQSPTASRFSFNWIINATASGLTIASTPNTFFALDFGPSALSLTDAGTGNERYTFSLALPKQVQPTQALSADNARSICYFNQTLLTGSLSTHGNRTAASDVSVPQNWTGSVYIEQSSPSGQGTPDCYRATDGSHITEGLGPQAMGRRCACGYESANGTAMG